MPGAISSSSTISRSSRPLSKRWKTRAAIRPSDTGAGNNDGPLGLQRGDLRVANPLGYPNELRSLETFEPSFRVDV